MSTTPGPLLEELFGPTARGVEAIVAETHTLEVRSVDSDSILKADSLRKGPPQLVQAAYAPRGRFRTSLWHTQLSISEDTARRIEDRGHRGLAFTRNDSCRPAQLRLRPERYDAVSCGRASQRRCCAS